MRSTLVKDSIGSGEARDRGLRKTAQEDYDRWVDHEDATYDTEYIRDPFGFRRAIPQLCHSKC